MYTTSPLSIYSEILTLTLKQLKPIKYKLKSKGSVIFMPIPLQTRLWRMKTNIFCFILIALLGITISTSIAQQNGDAPKTNTEVETLRKRVSELEDKLKIVENVEKMELAAKLAEAQRELLNADIDKLKLELKDSNQQWLWGWTTFLGVIFAVIGVALWFFVKSLIADRVEERLNGFKESVEQVKIQQERIKILEKEHAATVIDDILFYSPGMTYPYPERINAISDKTLLDVFNDEKRQIVCRCKAAEFLTDRQSELIVSPLITFLNSILDTAAYSEVDPNSATGFALRKLVNYLGMIHTQEIYNELTKFLNRLLRERTEMKDMFLTWTVFALAYIGSALNIGESVSIMKEAIADLKFSPRDCEALKNLARYFDKFKDLEAIKEILEHHGKTMNSDVKETCLTLLEKHDPKFVEEQRAAETTTNTESEETDEPKPTE